MEIIKKILRYIKSNESGSLTITALFTVLIFSLYGILLYARSASSYISIRGEYIVEEDDFEDGIVVTFNANGGTIPKSSKWNGSGLTASKKVRANSEYGILPIPIKNGYSFLGWVALPSIYQPVEYIESNAGGEFIDTGFIPTANTNVEIEFAYMGNHTYSGWLPMFGSKTGSDTKFGFWIHSSDLRIDPYYGSYDPMSTNLPKVKIGEKNNLRNEGSNFYLNGVKFDSTTSSFGKSTAPIYIFNIKGCDRFFKMRVY